MTASPPSSASTASASASSRHRRYSNWPVQSAIAGTARCAGGRRPQCSTTRFQYEPYARRVPSLTAADTTGTYSAKVGTACGAAGRRPGPQGTGSSAPGAPASPPRQPAGRRPGSRLSRQPPLAVRQGVCPQRLCPSPGTQYPVSLSFALLRTASRPGAGMTATRRTGGRQAKTRVSSRSPGSGQTISQRDKRAATASAGLRSLRVSRASRAQVMLPELADHRLPAARHLGSGHWP